MTVIPDAYRDLLNDKIALAALATVMPDGSPQVTPVWFDWTGTVIRVNTAKGRVKARNMAEGSAVALAIVDPTNAYRHLQIRGKVSRITEDGADAHIDSLAQKYLNQDKYPFRTPDQVRVIYEITPEHASVMG